MVGLEVATKRMRAFEALCLACQRTLNDCLPYCFPRTGDVAWRYRRWSGDGCTARAESARVSQHGFPAGPSFLC
jgi:hypothetical protein